MRILLREYWLRWTMRNGQSDSHKRSNLLFHHRGRIFELQIQLHLHGVGSYCRSFDKTPFFLSICSQMANSIYFSLHSKFDICSFNSHSIWICANFSPRRAYRVAKQHIESQTYRATRQRRISTLSLRVRHTTDSTCAVCGNIS